MKKVIAIIGILLVFSVVPAGVYAEETVGDTDHQLPPEGMEIEDEQNVTIFTIAGEPSEYWDDTALPYLRAAYDTDEDYTEVIITCLWPVASDAPSLDCGRAREIYASLKQSGIPEDMLYVSLQFENEIPDTGIIRVQFVKSASYFKRAGQNIVSGFTDIISSPVELPRNMVDESQKSGAAAGVPMGVFSGFGAAVRKAGTGTIKLLTFWAG